MPLFCHLFVLLVEEKLKCFPADGMLSRRLLLACVDCVRCKLKFLYQLGTLWNLLPFDSVSRWKGATVCFCTVQFSFTLNGFELGGWVWCFVFSSVNTDVISTGLSGSFCSSHGSVIGARLLNKDKFHWKCYKVSCIFSYSNDSLFF